MTDVTERMEQFVRQMAAKGHLTCIISDMQRNEARAIVAELDGPLVGIDLIEARKLAATRGDDMDARIIAGDYDKFECVFYRLEGIAKGRELAMKERGDLTVGTISVSLDAQKLLRFKEQVEAAVNEVFTPSGDKGISDKWDDFPPFADGVKRRD